LPFPGPDFVQQHLDEPPPPLRAFRPDIDERLERLVLDLLAKRPADRPQETAEVAARLRAVRWSQGGEALRDALRLGGTAGARVDGHGIPAAREGVGGGAEPEPGALASAAHPEEGAPNERFVPAAPPADGGEYPALAPFETALLEHDRALGRLCWRVPCDERRAAFVRACAAADHPHLQAVYDVDPEAGFARLEAPRAATLRALGVRAPRDLPTTLSAAARAQIAAALDALHVAGIAHGRVDADHVAIGPTRAVLLLPADHDPCASREADLAALDALARGG
jgi:serine/threonine-protein kinase